MARPLRRSLAGVLATVAVAASTFACTVATDASTDPELTQDTTTHALIQVRRTDPVRGEERANAVASFIRLPISADPGELLSLAGLRENLPPNGSCRTTSLKRPELDEQDLDARGLDPQGRDALFESDVELVPVDALALTTDSGSHRLAPRAFPQISDWLRGVVYTSRDQDPSSLPTSGRYQIRVSGVDGAFDIDTTHQSPDGVSGVTVGGIPFSDLRSLPTGAPLDLTWTPSESSLDVLTVSLATDELTHTCAFPDGVGAASLLTSESSPTFATGQPVTLSVHRVRTEASASETEAFVVEVRFDFARVTDISFD